MKIIHKSQIQPQYTFPEWDKKLKKGYVFHDITQGFADWSYYEILFRFKNWFLVKSK